MADLIPTTFASKFGSHGHSFWREGNRMFISRDAANPKDFPAGFQVKMETEVLKVDFDGHTIHTYEVEGWVKFISPELACT